ncbi:hypothetical protein PanWU01x14_323410 [Parasponia andersonii]|uniref:Uncharacterized protein n=1 Tax=Parasponia andersonii TaxID=3476 RepID=A0A2P5AKI1_PARAD|nr:hypothetical protein PanWU01x14_323410 [Parasponia andersonii]
MGVLKDVKERLLEKLVAAAVPAEALEKARRLLETVVRDATVAAHALSKDALHRIKTHLVDILPSLSPALTTKMVDEAEKEVEAEAETNENKEESSSTNNNYQESNKPSSRL